MHLHSCRELRARLAICHLLPLAYLGLAHPAGLEPAIPASVARCSIQLSHGCMMWRPTGVEPDRHGHHSTLDTVSHHNSRLSGMPTLRYGLLAFSYSLTLCRVTACGTSLSLLRTSRAAAIHGYGALALAQAVGFEPTNLSAFCFRDRCHKPLDHACLTPGVLSLRPRL